MESTPNQESGLLPESRPSSLEERLTGLTEQLKQVSDAYQDMVDAVREAVQTVTDAVRTVHEQICQGQHVYPVVGAGTSAGSHVSLGSRCLKCNHVYQGEGWFANNGI